MVCASQTVQSETAKTERRLSLGASCRCGPLCVCSQGNDSPSRKRTEQHLLSHKVHPRLTWTLGWPSVFVTWLNPKENKLLTSSWQEVALRFAARHPLKLGLQPCKETGTQGLCLGCWPHCSMVPGPWERQFWVLWLAKGYLSFYYGLLFVISDCE